MLIPHIIDFEDKRCCEPNHPGWMQVIDSKGKKIKPLIRCNCGKWCGIKLHHVHPDGRITASFYDADQFDKNKQLIYKGCGWHVYIELENWTGEEYLPGME